MGIAYHLLRWLFISGVIFLLLLGAMFLKSEGLGLSLVGVEIVWTIWACISLLTWMKGKMK